MINLSIPMKPAAKARPRVTSRGTYMPRDYTDWKLGFSDEALSQIVGSKAFIPICLDCAMVVTVWTPSGNMRPDVDNFLGAVMDALQPDILRNDGLVADARVIRRKAPKKRDRGPEFSPEGYLIEVSIKALEAA